MKSLAIAAACLFATLGAYADACSNPAPSNRVAAYDPSRLTVRPRVLSQARPVYPPGLYAQGAGATVLVDFLVDTAGLVQNAAVKGESNSDFGKSALEAVSQWKFSPGQVEGRVVFTHMQVPIVFAVSADEAKPKS